MYNALQFANDNHNNMQMIVIRKECENLNQHEVCFHENFYVR
jgi:hypothetical protein